MTRTGARSVNCPSCGAEVRFQSGATFFIVCSYCRSMLVRHDIGVEDIGKMAVLLDDVTPLQLGTRGTYDGARFQLIGRLRLSWEDGGWNEWFALFDDSRQAWVSDAQGFFMMSFAVESDPPAQDDLAPGGRVVLAGVEYSVDDIKQATCAGSEGELPFRAPIGRKSTSVDLSGPAESFACIDYSEDGVAVYSGRYFELAEIAPEGLRQLDGW